MQFLPAAKTSSGSSMWDHTIPAHHSSDAGIADVRQQVESASRHHRKKGFWWWTGQGAPAAQAPTAGRTIVTVLAVAIVLVLLLRWLKERRENSSSFHAGTTTTGEPTYGFSVSMSTAPSTLPYAQIAPTMYLLPSNDGVLHSYAAAPVFSQTGDVAYQHVFAVDPETATVQTANVLQFQSTAVVGTVTREMSAYGSRSQNPFGVDAWKPFQCFSQVDPVVTCVHPVTGVTVLGPTEIATMNGGAPLTWQQFVEGSAPVLYFSSDNHGRMPCVSLPQGTATADDVRDDGWVVDWDDDSLIETVVSSATSLNGLYRLDVTNFDMRVVDLGDVTLGDVTWRASSVGLAQYSTTSDGLLVTLDGYRLPQCTSLSSVPTWDATQELTSDDDNEFDNPPGYGGAAISAETALP